MEDIPPIHKGTFRFTFVSQVRLSLSPFFNFSATKRACLICDTVIKNAIEGVFKLIVFFIQQMSMQKYSRTNNKLTYCGKRKLLRYYRALLRILTFSGLCHSRYYYYHYFKAAFTRQTKVGKPKLMCVNGRKTVRKHVCKLLATNRLTNFFLCCVNSHLMRE